MKKGRHMLTACFRIPFRPASAAVAATDEAVLAVRVTIPAAIVVPIVAARAGLECNRRRGGRTDDATCDRAARASAGRRSTDAGANRAADDRGERVLRLGLLQRQRH